jgi:mannose-1-phosphate guanylyltransferase
VFINSSAVPANALYLAQYSQTYPERLAKNEVGGPEIVGDVYIHPTAIVDPGAKVCNVHKFLWESLP